MTQLRRLAKLILENSLAWLADARNKSKAGACHFRPAVTLLEDRLAPALLTVNSLADAPISGTTSTMTLREAIALIDQGGAATDSLGYSLAAAKASQIDTTNPFGVQDTIEFAPTLFGSSNQQIVLVNGELALSQTVTILGPGATQLAVNGDNQGQVFNIAGGATVAISGLTVEGGALLAPEGTAATSATSGGGILNAGTLTLNDSTISGNSALNGGGIANYGTLTMTGSTISDNAALLNDGGIFNAGTLTLVNSTISGNSAVVGNGGMANYGGAVTLTDSIVTGNNATGAGGIGNYGGTLALIGSQVTGNTASGAGGILNEGTLTLNGSTVAGNSAVNGGGLVNNDTLTLTDSTISGNTAVNGGGIANYGTLALAGSTITGNAAQLNNGGIFNTGTLTMVDSTISGNSAVVGNGGMANYGGAVALTDSLVTGNTASGAGGIGNYGGTLALANTIVSGNTASGAGGILNEAALTLTGSTVAGNSANNGGGLVNTGSLTLTDSTISGNSAINGGGIANYGTLAMAGSTVSGNSAQVSNAAIFNTGTVELTNSTIADNTLPAATVAPIGPAQPAPLPAGSLSANAGNTAAKTSSGADDARIELEAQVQASNPNHDKPAHTDENAGRLVDDPLQDNGSLFRDDASTLEGPALTASEGVAWPGPAGVLDFGWTNGLPISTDVSSSSDGLSMMGNWSGIDVGGSGADNNINSVSAVGSMDNSGCVSAVAPSFADGSAGERAGLGADAVSKESIANGNFLEHLPPSASVTGSDIPSLAANDEDRNEGMD